MSNEKPLFVRRMMGIASLNPSCCGRHSSQRACRAAGWSATLMANVAHVISRPAMAIVRRNRSCLANACRASLGSIFPAVARVAFPAAGIASCADTLVSEKRLA